MTGGFRTVFGRGLLAETRNFAPSPFLVVTMDDLWTLVSSALGEGGYESCFVSTIDLEELAAIDDGLPVCRSVVGVGGGRAVDVAKYLAWRRGLPLFQYPTSMSVNAPFGHRAGLREGGLVRYVGWAVPEAVYVDFDVIRSAPAALNRSGVGDVLCYHTAHRDWEIARDLGRCESRWPYDASLVAAARATFDGVVAHLDEIRDASDAGIRTLMEAHRWGGATFHDSGWNPRHIEGVEHFFFYNLERLTGRHFIHGQPVGLGTYLGSLLQDNHPDILLGHLHRVGVDIRPEAMGVTWGDVTRALETLPGYVREAGLWFTVADTPDFDPSVVADARHEIEARYGEWSGS